MQNLSFRKIGILVSAAVALFLTLSLGSQILETNDAGQYQVIQSLGSGNMSIRSTPGTYYQGGATVTTYQVSDVHYFTKNHSEGGKVTETEPIRIRFSDGGTAAVTGSIKFRLPSNPEKQLLLHNEFKSFERVKHDLIRQVVQEALNKTSAIMKAEESYSSRLAEFTTLAEEQIRIGIYETTSEQVTEKDSDGNTYLDSVVRIKTDKNGNKILAKKSPLEFYGIEVINFVIKDFDFDDKTEAIIVKKKEAEQEKVVSRAKAERAKQEAITSQEEGKARVAKAEADALVEKKTAVINAERETEVAKQEKLKAREEAEAVLTAGRAQAESNRLKVSAGLTPQERAEYQMKTAIGVAEKLSQIKLPEMMVMGGGEKGHQADPFTAIGLESFMRINERMVDKKNSDK